MTEHQLMKAIAAGDSRAADELNALYRRRVFKYLLGSLHNEDDALELTQDVLFRVCKKAGSFDGRAPLAAWIFRIARNRQVDHFRSRHFKAQQSSVEMGEHMIQLVEGSGSPERAMMQGEIFQRVQAAIAELPDRQREVVRMRLLGELKLEEIAETIGLTSGGVKSTLHNALRSLRLKLADLERENYVAL